MTVHIDHGITSAAEAHLSATFDRLADVAPGPAQSAADVLDESLAPVRRSRLGAVAWACSRLTPPGLPVEIAITSASSEVRTVSEVRAPEDDPRSALGRALAIASRRGADAPDPRLARDLSELQQQAPHLRFGAWLGARHRSDGPRFKVYVELPAEGTASLLDRWAPATLRALSPLGGIRFVGVHLDGSGGLEVYSRARHLDPPALDTLCSTAGLGTDAGPLIAAVQRHGWRRTTPFCGRNFSLSIAVDGGGAARAAAVFAFASSVHGADSAVRAALVADSAEGRWPSALAYERISAPLTARGHHTRPYHGPLSFVLTDGGTVDRHVGLAPPPPTEGDTP